MYKKTKKKKKKKVRLNTHSDTIQAIITINIIIMTKGQFFSKHRTYHHLMLFFVQRLVVVLTKWSSLCHHC